MREKLKICSPQLGMYPKSTLGGEVHDYEILSSLAKRGHKILVYLPKGLNYEVNSNIRVERAPIKHIPAFFFNFLIIPYLFRTYKKEKFDILRVHSPYYSGLGAIIFKIFHKDVPVVATYHLKEEGLIFKFINRLIANKFDAYITVSSYLKDWLNRDFNVDKSKIKVIYNGVDKQIKPQKKNVELLNKYQLQNKTVFLYMGLLVERKNPMFLLTLYKNIKENHKNTALVICGEGPLKEEMSKFINNNNIKDVIFAGNVTGKDKVKHLNLCDIFLMPSKNEGFGLVVAEAIACKKVVVASKNSSLAELVVDGQNGLLAATNDLTEWLSKVELLLKNGDKISELSKNAHKIAQEKFSWQKAAELHEKLFLKIYGI